MAKRLTSRTSEDDERDRKRRVLDTGFGLFGDSASGGSAGSVHTTAPHGKGVRGRGGLGSLLGRGHGAGRGRSAFSPSGPPSDEDEESESEEDDGDDPEDESDDIPFEIELESGWIPFDAAVAQRMLEAQALGQRTLEYNARGQSYIVDLTAMLQTNKRTGVRRQIRRCIIDDEKEMVDLPGLPQLRGLLRAAPPSPPQLAAGDRERLDAQQIRDIVVKHVPDAVNFIAPRSNGTPALDFLVRSYDHGLPAFPPAVSAHLAEGVQIIMSAIWDPERCGIAKSRARFLAEQLAEAFTNCQAVQARTIDSLQAEVRGVGSRSLVAQLRALVEEHREMALDRTVCHFHPRAVFTDDSEPMDQLPHLANRYRRHLGTEVGLGGPRSKAAAADRNAQGPLPVSRRRAVRQFWHEFNVHEIVRAVVADVNQADPEANRRIDRQLLMARAGTEPAIAHRIFFDESKRDLYGDLKPSSEQLELRQPVLHDALAVEVLLVVLKPAEEASIE